MLIAGQLLPRISTGPHHRIGLLISGANRKTVCEAGAKGTNDIFTRLPSISSSTHRSHLSLGSRAAQV